MIFVIILLIIVSIALLGIAVVITKQHSQSDTDVRGDRAVYELKPLNKMSRSKEGVNRSDRSEQDFTEICLSAFSSSDDEDRVRGDQSPYYQHRRGNYECPDPDSSCDELERCGRGQSRGRQQRPEIIVAPHLVGTIV
ncbi:unnamed protein product [Allacma fusca]|uniref:Uncharacterized protein n=1 Tax=Allacma fusca TaxID=39272 RepID=A0A8J2JN03_9HEXA|nr:unnamed protein product [Allacma fusca]